MSDPILLDGRALAQKLDQNTAREIATFNAGAYHPICLAVILVGHNPASEVYVRNKIKRCESVGIQSRTHRLDEGSSPDALHKLICDLNDDPSVHGILLQLPLPAGFPSEAFISEIAPIKDVDGFHPKNFGLFMAGYGDALGPCTPQACMRLLGEVIDEFSGLHATVVGASNIVGKPMAQLLVQAGCSVTTVHHLSTAIPEKCIVADIVIAAAGSPKLVRSDWIKKGAIVIDVGINRSSTAAQPNKIVGDVDFDDVAKRARAITPVPGGVGPMTISYLLINTLKAATLQCRLEDGLVSRAVE